MNPDTFYKGLIVLILLASVSFVLCTVIDIAVLQWREKQRLKGSFKMKKRIKIDRETGFPVVPEGYYWRVTQVGRPHEPYTRALQVTLVSRESPDWGWSLTLTSDPSRVRKRHLQRIAKQVYRYWVENNFESPFIGTYPPKTLRGVK